MAVFKCPACGYEKLVPEGIEGRPARCPECGMAAVVTDAGQDGTNQSAGVVIDLENVELDQSTLDSVVCKNCEHILESCDENDGICPECGDPVCVPDPEVSEEEIDLSDFERDSGETWEHPDTDDHQAVGEGFEEELVERASTQGRLLRGGFANNVFAGLVAGLLGYIGALCMGLLTGSQVPDGLFLPFSASMALVAATLGGFLFSLRSRLPFALAGPESVMCGVLFLYVGSLYSTMNGVAPPDAIVPTLTAGVVVATVVTGLSLYALGRLGAGLWVRFTPVQVVCGVVGGVGVFIMLAALCIITSEGGMPHGILPGVHMLRMTFDLSAGPLRWGPPLLLGILLFLLSFRFSKGPWLLVVLGLCIIGGQAVHVWLPEPVLLKIFEPFSMPVDAEAFHATILKAGFWGSVEWWVIVDHAYYIGALIALGFIKVMYRGALLEAVSPVAEDGTDDFEAMGLANVGSALLGGMPVSFSRSRSLGNLALGGGGALSGIIAALICGGLYLAGDIPVTALPRFVPEGLLFYFGLSLVFDWMIRGRTAFSRRDDVVGMVVVFLITLVLGVVIGVGFGVAFGALMSIRRFSREGGIRTELSGAVYHSNVDRAPAQARLLREVGDHIHVICLNGFVFLGSMEKLVERVRYRTLDQERLDVEFLVVDFGGVTGFATFSNLGFGKLRNLALDEELNVVFTRVPLELEEYLAKSGFATNDMEGSFNLFMDLDFALEWCENRLLEAEGISQKNSGSLQDMLAPFLPDPRYAQALGKIMKRLEVNKGDILFRQGDPSDTMYFVEKGALEVEMEKDGRKHRLKKVGPGAVVGEMGIYTASPRSATVRASEDSVLYLLTRKKLELAERKVPKLVTVLNRFLINLMSERLAEANRRNRDLM
ncbi:cyclic nucleotide-binding domain-containing protein [Salidesulfovibrio brasiliensis]|uniref:cyclic nucleotide-binding domain-containing protein n=1 Tax=Salidesulfovibrio brasiliensis TaxID=221711 RepID=UPI0006CFF451|nr:cyclic nucleotide-binding domain-containing protein [Salidesulfovibrio brasiliensis]